MELATRTSDQNSRAAGSGVPAFLAALPLILPFALGAMLARFLEPSSFAGLSLALAFGLALPLPMLIARDRAQSIGWLRIGLTAIGLLLILDILGAWMFEAGPYAAASFLAKAILLLQLPTIAVAAETTPRSLADVARVFVWSLPALAVTLFAGLVPAKVLTLLLGSEYVTAAPYLRLLGGGMALAGLSIALVQLLIGSGRISWVLPMSTVALLALPATIALGSQPEHLALFMLLANALVFAALVRAVVGAVASPSSANSVLFLSWRDLNHPEGGGSEMFVEEMARHLAKQGRRVTIFCASYPNAPHRELVEGVQFIRRGGRFSVYAWAALYHLFGRLPRHDVLVDTQNGVPFFAPLYCSRPVIVLLAHVCKEQWGLSFSPRLARLGSLLESRVAPATYRGARFIVMSEATQLDVMDLGVDPATISLIHNGTPLPVETLEVAKSERPSICCLGRLVPHKRIELLLEAAERLRGAYPDLKVTVMGRGWWEKKLQATAQMLGVQDVVRFLGRVDEETKARVLQESWVLAMPSAREGWGIVIMEAGGLGTPAVSFRAGGLAESIRDGQTGVLVDDFDGFVAALERLLADRELRTRLGEEARAWARQFSWDESASRFLEVVDSVARLPGVPDGFMQGSALEVGAVPEVAR